VQKADFAVTAHKQILALVLVFGEEGKVNILIVLTQPNAIH
jgi:hypothetical protein